MNFNEYQVKAWSTFKLEDSPIKMLYLALGLCGEAGEVAEKIKKIIRDVGNGEMPELTKEQKELLKKELGDVLWYNACLANVLGISFDEVAVDNIAKLQSRKERNKIGGSGDDR